MKFNKIIASFIAVVLSITCIASVSPLCVDDLFITAEAATDSYKKWKQTDSKWGNKLITPSDKNSTLKGYGCAVTSIAMNIVKAGIRNESNYNPGVCLEDLQKVKAFNSNSEISFTAVTKAYPDFEYKGIEKVQSKSKQDALKTVSDFYNKGYYLLVCVSTTGKSANHYVAVDSASGTDVNILDPGGLGCTKLKDYPKIYNIVYYQKKGNKPSTDTDSIVSDELKVGSTYVIEYSGNTSLCITANGNKNKSNICLGKTDTSNKNNRWTVEKEGNNIRLKNVGTGKYMDVAVNDVSKDTKNNTNIWQYDKQTKASLSKTQQFSYAKVTNGKNVYYRIKLSYASSFCIDAAGDNPKNGSNIQVYKVTGGSTNKTQLFVFKKV